MWMGLLKLIPGVSSLLQWGGNFLLKAYDSKLQAQGTHEAKVTELAIREMQLDETEARLNAQSKSQIRGNFWAPENLFAYLIAIPYWFKAVTIDNVIGSFYNFGFSTPALKGDTAKAMMMIMTFWLGARAVQSVASIIGAAFGRR